MIPQSEGLLKILVGTGTRVLVRVVWTDGCSPYLFDTTGGYYESNSRRQKGKIGTQADDRSKTTPKIEGKGEGKAPEREFIWSAQELYDACMSRYLGAS